MLPSHLDRLFDAFDHSITDSMPASWQLGWLVPPFNLPQTALDHFDSAGILPRRLLRGLLEESYTTASDVVEAEITVERACHLEPDEM
ncbi:unnamed protein product [Protopolystoma xenopodis]|uniref:Uncharacterized protein n=1 Tax=Protopolystoma xenopodis TaxID=117903 RepID=A0A3S5CK41_9PLAT|nr:unnamed protein product [Protopolystoma xenopodis]